MPTLAEDAASRFRTRTPFPRASQFPTHHVLVQDVVEELR